MPPEAVRYCGRLFSEQEMRLIRAIIVEDPNRHRFALSQVVCERLHWRRANGQLKDMSCRVAMLRMHRDGLIQLLQRHPAPAVPRRRNRSCHRPRRCAAGAAATTARRSARSAIVARVRGPLPLPRLYAAAGSTDALPGHQPAARAGGRRLWRQRLEGGSPRPLHRLERCPTRSRLQLVVNNARFLILPWVQVRNLGCWMQQTTGRLATATAPVAFVVRPLPLPRGADMRATRSGATGRLCAPLNPPPHR